jgi:hypothetical protein
MFADSADARRAVFDLEEAKYPLADVSVAMKEQGENAFGGSGSLLDIPISNQARTAPMEHGQAPTADLYAIQEGELAEFGPIVAAGPLAEAIGGAALGVAAGGLVGSLTNVGIPNETARKLVGRVRSGQQTLVAIKAPPADSERVQGLFLENGAAEVYVSRSHKRTLGEGERSIALSQVGF